MRVGSHFYHVGPMDPDIWVGDKHLPAEPSPRLGTAISYLKILSPFYPHTKKAFKLLQKCCFPNLNIRSC